MRTLRRRVVETGLLGLALVVAAAGSSSAGPASPAEPRAADEIRPSVAWTQIGNATIAAFDHDDTAPRALQSGVTGGALAAEDDRDLYYATSSGVVRLPADGTGAIVVQAEGDPVVAVAVKDSWLYSAVQQPDDEVLLKKLDLDGRDGPETVATGLPYLSGIDVERDGSVVAAAFETDELLRISPAGAVTTVADSFDGPNGPHDVAVTPTGDVLLASTLNGTVYRLPAGSDELEELTTLSQPWSIDVGSRGDVLVYSYDQRRIFWVEPGTTRPRTLLDGVDETEGIAVWVTDPTLEAIVESESDPSASGWYGDPVTVEWPCEPGSAPIAGGCPDPVRKSNADQRVRRSVTGLDTGYTEASVRVRVDTTPPVVETRREGRAPYPRDATPVRCTASDALSGLSGTCRVTYGAVKRRDDGSRYRSWTARSSDRARNVTTRRGTFGVR